MNSNDDSKKINILFEFSEKTIFNHKQIERCCRSVRNMLNRENIPIEERELVKSLKFCKRISVDNMWLLLWLSLLIVGLFLMFGMQSGIVNRTSDEC